MIVYPGDICFLTGMHKAPHQTMCQICGSGFFQIHWGQEICDVCPENHYCPVSAAPPIVRPPHTAVSKPCTLHSTPSTLHPPLCNIHMLYPPLCTLSSTLHPPHSDPSTFVFESLRDDLHVCPSCYFLRVQMWTPFCVQMMPFVQRAVWLQATAWRPSSANQGILASWLLSLLLC